MVKVKQSKNKKIILAILVIMLIGIIIGSIIIKNTVINQEAEEEGRLAGANQNSGLIANNIKKGITIGGITGTLETLDTSDATATPDEILEGETAYVNGEKITGTMKAGPKLGDITGNETQNTESRDNLGNKIVVPAGFKVVNPTDNVEKGIIIEDVSAGNSNTKGSQFVWVPIGKIQTSQGEKNIQFGRYDFESNVNGTLVQSAKNWSKTSSSVAISGNCKELPNSSYGNKVAKELKDFIVETQKSGGFYIGRYEAGDANATNEARTNRTSDNNPIVCKSGVYPYSYITQEESSNLCQNMYSDDYFTSDLVNSYAWDTAVMFIQQCSGDTNYSMQAGTNTANSLQKVGESTLNKVDSGDEAKDVRCNIYDMAGNVMEWTTETYDYSSGTRPCVYRGGYYDGDTYFTRARMIDYTDENQEHIACRPIIYL